ncbi:MAG: hypothetical protein BGO12_03645 [Verrucomicrobia bacterium 61-8]|nr:MAG: hypothetical protein BGO12_03645 [Verrucomicrobia bacterium 61-8]
MQPWQLPLRHAVIFLLLGCGLASAQQGDVVESSAAKFRVETVADGMTNPLAIAKLPDGRFLITERPGRLRIVENGKLLPDPVEGVPEVWAKGQGGLLDVVLHPDYARNGWIYLSFSKPLPKGALTSVIRARLKDNKLVDQETIFDPPADEATGAGVHFGCKLTFDKEGHLFFSIGDRGDVTNPTNNAQRVDNVKGKIHRVMDDGSIPPDNPYANTPGARPTIWCNGNRNPQGLIYDLPSGILWETEHGPRGGDELNIIRKGLNYGWPTITYGINYSGTPITDHTSQDGMEQPITYWTPSLGACGLTVYHGDKFPQWEGNLFAGALALTKIVRAKLDGQKVVEQEDILKGTGRIRDLRVFDDGYLYVVYDNPGKVVRLVPAN